MTEMDFKTLSYEDWVDASGRIGLTSQGWRQHLLSNDTPLHIFNAIPGNDVTDKAEHLRKITRSKAPRPLDQRLYCVVVDIADDPAYLFRDQDGRLRIFTKVQVDGILSSITIKRSKVLTLRKSMEHGYIVV